jgi:hypothetical protein
LNESVSPSLILLLSHLVNRPKAEGGENKKELVDRSLLIAIIIALGYPGAAAETPASYRIRFPLQEQ